MREKASAFRGSKCRYWILHLAIPQWLHTGKDSIAPMCLSDGLHLLCCSKWNVSLRQEISDMLYYSLLLPTA